MRGFKRKIDVYNRIEISEKSLLHNAEYFRQKTKLQIIPVIKSNAYGHGITPVSKALSRGDFPMVAVDGYFEAQKIRKLAKHPILVMGMIKPDDFKKINTKNIEFVVQDKTSLQAISRLNKNIKIHLDINTGMNRYGIAPAEIDEYLSLLSESPKIQLAGIMTHLADPDAKDDSNIKQSVELFDKSVAKILEKGFKPKLIHIGQSASSVRLKSKYANATRLGLSLYGLNPFDPDHELYGEFKQNLKPVLKLISTISKINHLKAGDGVSYNYTFRAKKPMSVAVLPLGYYEGVHWQLGNKGKVKLGEKYLPIVGKVCMNHTMVDVTESKAQIGDEVLIFSDNPDDKNSLNIVAERHKLFIYELPTKLSADVRRILV